MIKYKSLLESLASAAAHRMGLTYFGFGRYGKDDHVTHVSHADRLVPVKQSYPASKGEGVLLHYEHLEDQVFNRGSEGARQAIDTLHGLVHGDNRIGTQTKIDGAPSLFLGKHPTTGKFFIATKSLYNKDAKVNYTHEDIDKNHGHAPGLTAKLHAALDELPKIYKGDKVVQGDMMFEKSDVDVRDIDGKKHYTFKPNVTRNAIPVDSPEGKQIARAKIGIAIHTKYNADQERLPADHTDVKSHPDVFVMKIDAPSAQADAHKEKLSALGAMVAKTPKESFEFVKNHQDLLKQYANHKIKTGGDAVDGDDFIKWVHAYKQKDIDKVKTDKAKQAKSEARDSLVKDLKDNVHHLHRSLAVHKAIADLKDDIINTFDKHQKVQRFFDTENGIEKTGPEGYVAIGHHGTHKLVKRKEFSFANFTQNKNWGDKEKEEQKEKSAVVTLGRMSPPHVEHGNLINAVTSHAKSTGADPFVYVTHTQDKKTNPLSADEKLEVLNKMYPEHKGVFHATNPNAPSLTHVMADLHAKGYKNVTVVLGDDRTKDFEYLHKYNGKFNDDGKGYKFDKINIISRHSIKDTRQDSGDGVHASDLRKAAKNDDFDTFRKGMHPNVSDTLTKSLMKKIKERLA